MLFQNFSYPLFAVAIFCSKLFDIIAVIFFNNLLFNKLLAEQLNRKSDLLTSISRMNLQYSFYTQ